MKEGIRGTSKLVEADELHLKAALALALRHTVTVAVSWPALVLREKGNYRQTPFRGSHRHSAALLCALSKHTAPLLLLLAKKKSKREVSLVSTLIPG